MDKRPNGQGGEHVGNLLLYMDERSVNDEKSSELEHPCVETERPEGILDQEWRFRLRF